MSTHANSRKVPEEVLLSPDLFLLHVALLYDGGITYTARSNNNKLLYLLFMSIPTIPCERDTLYTLFETLAKRSQTSFSPYTNEIRCHKVDHISQLRGSELGLLS